MALTPGEPHTPGESPRLFLNIASLVEELALVDAASERFARMVGLDDDSMHTFSIAVREAAANAIRHGNAGDPGKQVRIEFDTGYENGRCCALVRIRDEGAGFDPSCVPDPLAPANVEATSGRGIFLMRCFMDDVSVAAAPGGGTEIVLRKAVPGALGTP
jgi:serine/threonine-protein kinase RsbW